MDSNHRTFIQSLSSLKVCGRRFKMGLQKELSNVWTSVSATSLLCLWRSTSPYPGRPHMYFAYTSTQAIQGFWPTAISFHCMEHIAIMMPLLIELLLSNCNVDSSSHKLNKYYLPCSQLRGLHAFFLNTPWNQVYHYVHFKIRNLSFLFMQLAQSR